MPDARDAAVEAMAAALHAEWKGGMCPHVGKWHACRINAKTALAAFTDSEAVRAALDGGLNRILDQSLRLSGGACERMEGKCCSYHEGFADALDQAADTILAALRPDNEGAR